MRKKISYALKLLTIICSLGGVLIALITATNDGYSHWSKRLLYFTSLSNLWLGFTFLTILLAPLLRFSARNLRRLYLLKYVFTVCIFVTFFVFFLFLAPFADETYHVWEFSSLLTHFFAPVFAIIDFFVDEQAINLQKKHTFLALAPPLLYLSLTLLLSGFNVDFGRGVSYPYYFMNYRSPAGFFGFTANFPFFMGTFYWVLIFAGLVYSFAWGFIYLRTRLDKQHNP